MKKILSIIFSVLMILSATQLSAYAENGSLDSTNANVVTLSSADDTNFIPITREEYISTKANHLGISYSEAEAIVDQKINDAIERLPVPYSWGSDTTITNPDGTFTLYGRVNDIYTHESGLSAIYEVQAVKVASHYGSTWADCDSTGSAYPYGSGAFDFSGNCTASLISTTLLRMTINGNFDIEESVAISMGINLALFNENVSVGNTLHHRAYISAAHTEVA